jgi:hypothetical protein
MPTAILAQSKHLPSALWATQKPLGWFARLWQFVCTVVTEPVDYQMEEFSMVEQLLKQAGQIAAKPDDQ